MAIPASVTSSLEEQHRFYVRRLRDHGGGRFLDAGCGIGRSLSVARQEIPASQWVGIDRLEKSLRTARKNLGDSVPPLLVGDLGALPFPDGVFDGLLSRDTLECVEDPALVLDELARVVKPGGIVVVSHWDWDTAIYSCSDLTITRQMTRAFADAKQDWMERIDPAMGRKLHGLVLNSGRLNLLEAGVSVMLEMEWAEGHYGFNMAHDLLELAEQQHLLPRAEVAHWLNLLEQAAVRGEYLFSANHYWCLAGRRDD